MYNALLSYAYAIPGQEYYKTSISYRTDEPVWSLRSINDHKTDSGLQIDFGNHATGMANARSPMTQKSAFSDCHRVVEG